MKNPIGKNRREKLEKIDLAIESFEDKFNFVVEKLTVFELIRDDMRDFVGKMEPIIDIFNQPEEEVDPKQLEEEQKAQFDLMKEVVKGALVDLMNDEQNQEALKQLIQGLRGGEEGLMDLGLDLDMLRNKDGEIDPLAAGIMWFMNRDKFKGRAPVKATTGTTGRTGAY